MLHCNTRVVTIVHVWSFRACGGVLLATYCSIAAFTSCLLLNMHDCSKCLVKRAGALHPVVPEPLRRRMATFLADLHHAATVARTFGAAGGPWEFNLRDLLRWCQLAEGAVPAGGVSTLEGAAQVTLMLSSWQYDTISNSLNRRSRFTCALPTWTASPKQCFTGASCLQQNC
jgi:Midasin AAA lid domain